MRTVRIEVNLLLIAGAVLGFIALFLPWMSDSWAVTYFLEGAEGMDSDRICYGLYYYGCALFFAGILLLFFTQIGGIVSSAGWVIFLWRAVDAGLALDVLKVGFFVGIVASSAVLASMFISVTIDGSVRVRFVPRSTPLRRRLFVIRGVDSRLDVGLEFVRSAGFVLCIVSLSIGWLYIETNHLLAYWDPQAWAISPLDVVAPEWKSDILYLFNCSVLTWVGAYVFIAGVGLTLSRHWSACIMMLAGLVLSWLSILVPAPYGSLYEHVTGPSPGFYLSLTGAVLVTVASGKSLRDVGRRVRTRLRIRRVISSLG